MSVIIKILVKSPKTLNTKILSILKITYPDLMKLFCLESICLVESLKTSNMTSKMVLELIFLSLVCVRLFLKKEKKDLQSDLGVGSYHFSRFVRVAISN